MSSYEKGYEAYLDGKRRNPPKSVESPIAWLSGYRDAQRFEEYPH